jgi:hypothetical protein
MRRSFAGIRGHTDANRAGETTPHIALQPGMG